MKKIIVIISITGVVIIMVLSGVLFINYFRSLPYTQMTKEQRESNYKEYYEKHFSSVKDFWPYIPLIFKDGLEFDEISRINSPGSRTVKTSQGEEKVTVVDGYRIMYKYPETGYFAKMHVEKSQKEEYENDKQKVIDQLKLLSNQAQGKHDDYSDSYKGYEYYYIGNNDFNASPVGVAAVFFSENQIITTIYFLTNPKPSNRKFQTIEEFKLLKDNFIKELIDNKIKNISKEILK